jgi:predicted permease
MLATLLTRLRGLLQRRRVAREMDDELDFHLEMEIRSNIERGVPPAEARRVALRDFGGVIQTKEAIRDVRATWIESIWQDARYASRYLLSRPGAGLAAVGMLALGIGITTAMFTIVDALILRPVPFRAPDELARIYMGNEHGGRTAVAPAVLRAWRGTQGFAGAEAAVADTAILDVGGAVVTQGMARVTPGLFQMLDGVRPVRGRLFDATEGGAGTDDRVLVSEDVWRDLYGADPALVGRRITINRESLVIVGILPSEFRFPAWDTVVWRASDFAGGRPFDWPQVYVRFAADVPREDALRLATDAARAADPKNAALWPRIEPLAGIVLDSYYQRAVPLLAGGVLLVFLVLCANVCSLLLARLTARRREFSMRSALGATRGRLMRQALVESGVLGAAGVLAGTGVAWLLISLSQTFLPEAFLIRTLNPLNLDLRALLVASGAGIAGTLAAGLLPAWIATRIDVDDSLRVTERGGTETRAARALTRGLLVTEVALACTLLVGGTLLVRSFINLAGAERGLEVSGIITAWMSLPQSDFPDRASREAVAGRLEEQIRSLPGVQNVAWSYGVPPDRGAISFGEWVPDTPGAAAVDMDVQHYNVGPDFFALYGIPLLRGRTFQPSDTYDQVVVGERFAHAVWPDRDPIGRAFSFGRQRFHVIGLVREIHHPSLDPDVDRPEFYHPFTGVGDTAMLSVRCGGGCPDPARVRQRLAEAHAAVSVHSVRQLDDVYFEQLARPRAAAALGFAFAAIAVLAAAGGLFSVLSYAVGRRRREFGIRTALGASPAQIGRLVMRDGLLVGGSGIAIGTIVAWSLARTMVSLQYGVTIRDPVSWLLVLGLLAVTTIASSWRPAREAMRVDPVLLLRAE